MEVTVVSPPLPWGVVRNKGDGLAATGTAIAFELVDLFCQVLEIRHGADENLELELLVTRSLWL